MITAPRPLIVNKQSDKLSHCGVEDMQVDQWRQNQVVYYLKSQFLIIFALKAVRQI